MAAMADVDLYLLRVWKCRPGERGFRAALRPVQGDAAQVFSDPRRLADYLDGLAASPVSTNSATAPAQRAPGVPAIPSTAVDAPTTHPSMTRPRVRRGRRARRSA